MSRQGRPKQIQISNVQMTETNPLHWNLENECRTTQFGSFGFWSFDIVSDFVFRASNFRFYGEASHTLLWGASSKPFALGGDYLLLPSGYL
jgi:hypothetical protein